MKLMHGYKDRGHGHGTHAVCTEDGKPLEMTAENVERIVNLWNFADELEGRVRMLSDIAMSAIALKLNIENGFPPTLDALNRDLAAYWAKYKSAVPVLRPCRWCDEGYAPVPSSVSNAWVHPDSPVGRVVCPNRTEIK